MLYKLRNIVNSSDFGLVIDWKFHSKGKWVSAFSKYLVDTIVKEFHPIVISSQADYNLHKRKLRYLISMEPGWAAPKLEYDITQSCTKAVFYSDPHFMPAERFAYFEQNEFDYVYSFYNTPFFRHFPNFSKEKFIHFPWAVPDYFVNTDEITAKKSGEVAIFGGKNSDAYDMRNWCRQQEGVTNFFNSGVENKGMSDQEYYQWLTQFDAIVAAGSSDSKYDLVTPKYFEIMGAGALLIGHYCQDFENLGFGNDNMLMFRTKEAFLEVIKKFKANPESFVHTRENGRNHILKHHTISKRIELIKETLYASNGTYRS